MFNFLTTKTNKIGTSAAIIGSLTFLAQILALARNKIFATEFGASEILDLYNTAFKIPDLLFLLIGMMVSGSILIPFLTTEEQNGKEKYQLFITQILFSFSAILIFLATILFFLMPFLIQSFFPGFIENNQLELIKLSRLMLFSPILMGIANVFISLNQKNNAFLAVASTGIFYNLAIIISIYTLYPLFGLTGLVYGVLSGSLFYLLLQLPAIFKNNLFPKKISFLNLNNLKKYFWKALPRSLALFIASFIPIYLYSQASKMATGSITILQFALSLYFTPIALITTSYSMAIFPQLAKFFVEKKTTDFSNTVSDIISRILFFSLPITFFFIVFAPELIGFFYGSHKFNINDINSTATIFAIFSLVIIIQSLNIIFSRILYAVGNTSVTMFSNSLALFSLISLVLISQIFFPISLFRLAIFFTLAYLISFLYLFFITKKTVKNYLKLNNIFFLQKTIISILTALLTRIILGLEKLSIQKTFFDYTQTLILAAIIFIIIFIILSEILQEKNYLNLKIKVINLYKK